MVSNLSVLTSNFVEFEMKSVLYGFSDSVESNPDTDRHAGNSPTTCQAGILARFFSLSGHVALRHMVHLDVGVLGEIKRRQVIEENDKEKEKQAKKTRGAGSECTANSTKVRCKVGWTDRNGSRALLGSP